MRLTGEDEASLVDEIDTSEVVRERQNGPLCDNGFGVTSQLAWVTPEVATELIRSLGKKQRSISKLKYASMRNDLVNDRWIFNGETMVVDKDEFLIDGKHRCLLVIETGIPIFAMVVRGVSPQAYNTIDSGSGRKPSDNLKSKGYKNSRELAGAATFLYRYQNRLIAGMGNARQAVSLSPPQVDEIVEAHHSLEDSIAATVKAAKVVRSHAVAAFCHYILFRVNDDDTTEFFDALATGANLDSGNPILALRNFVTGAKKEDLGINDYMINRIFKVWNKWRSGGSLQRINKDYHAGTLHVPR